ncbi:helix-turn-helix domain-containing protein [Flavihumibacter fluvii]|uniref:helix-turn-helix domain-containing protein n=1 Tax=Flavihumibacter fluvii TaxID=2838157 RepID=UPI001BDE04A5|nr:XRE family transcriptional regulator [Flavihumibacter fluvii]ULQ51975.1 XRE family transcriptional regulator [Flavihumibacter fluvii]
MQYFPDRLKSARKMNGLSLQELSEKLNNTISKQDLNRLESGIMQPDSKLLSALTNALQVTNDYFFKKQTITLELVEFRKLASLPKKEQEIVKGKTAEFLERYIELENLLGINSSAPFKYQEFKIKDQEDIEKAASKLREYLKIGTDPIYNINELLEENGIKIFPIKSQYAFSGMSAQINKNLMLIVYNDDPAIPVVRKRFTILHELAHLFLNLSGFDEKSAERFCDSFAGALLLPSAKIVAYFGGKRDTVFVSELKNIKEYYGISLSAIMYRAKTLHLVSDHYHKYFMIKYNRQYKASEGTGYNGKEQSQRFIQLLMRAVAQDIISTTKASSLNNQKLGDFRKEYLDLVSA